MLIDRSDKIINVCEIKYSKDKYAITKDYKDLVLQIMELFKKITKTNKTLKCTFITNKGLKIVLTTILLILILILILYSTKGISKNSAPNLLFLTTFGVLFLF